MLSVDVRNALLLLAIQNKKLHVDLWSLLNEVQVFFLFVFFLDNFGQAVYLWLLYCGLRLTTN
jgi:hypothetical protein